MKQTFLALALAISFLSGCSHIPGVKEPTEEELNAESAKAYEKVKAESKRSTNAEWTAMVERVSKRIAAASGENFQWEYILIENPEPNAWCMPGGKMAVYTGIMPVLKTEAALAAVMGHEVAHATRRHGAQRYARAMRSNIIGLVAGAAIAGGGQLLCKSKACKMVTGLGGAAAGFAVAFFDRKFSRGDESDADKFGQIYMAKAGYDPEESIKLWERMGAANAGKAPPEWMSTHPSDSTRQENLRNWMPEAKAAYSQAPQKFGIGAPIR